MALVKKTEEAFLEIPLNELFIREFRTFDLSPPIADFFDFRFDFDFFTLNIKICQIECLLVYLPSIEV